MDAVKSWVTTLCFAAVAAGMAGILAPAGKMEKSFRFAVSLFFLACVLVPVFGIRQISLPALSLGTASSGGVQSGAAQTAAGQEQAEVKSRVTALVRQCCGGVGVVPLGVETEVSVETDGVKVSSCLITLKKSDMAKKSRLAAAVRSQLGLSASFRQGPE